MLATETLFDGLLCSAAKTLNEAQSLYDAGCISDATYSTALDVYALVRRSLPGGYVVPAEARVLGFGDMPPPAVLPHPGYLFPAPTRNQYPATAPDNVVDLNAVRAQRRILEGAI